MHLPIENEDVVALAVGLLAGIARAHAFAQGNKRTCFVAMVQFFNARTAMTPRSRTHRHGPIVIGLVEHRTTEAALVRGIRPFAIAK